MAVIPGVKDIGGTYDGKVVVPDEPLDLEPGARVRVTPDLPSVEELWADVPLTEEVIQRRMNAIERTLGRVHTSPDFDPARIKENIYP